MASNDHARIAMARNPTQSTVVKARQKMKQQEARSYKSALRTVYWISSEEIANCKYPSLLQFQREQGVKDIIQMNRGKNCKKESPESFNELLHSLSEVRNCGFFTFIGYIVNAVASIYILYGITGFPEKNARPP